MKDIASSETKGHVWTDDLENTLGSAFLQAYYIYMYMLDSIDAPIYIHIKKNAMN